VAVIAGNRQPVITIVQQAATQQSHIHLQIVPAEAALDRHLPQAGCAEQYWIVSIVDQSTGVRGQSVRFTSSLAEKMSIKQQLHAPPPPNIC